MWCKYKVLAFSVKQSLLLPSTRSSPYISLWATEELWALLFFWWIFSWSPFLIFCPMETEPQTCECLSPGHTSTPPLNARSAEGRELFKMGGTCQLLYVTGYIRENLSLFCLVPCHRSSDSTEVWDSLKCEATGTPERKVEVPAQLISALFYLTHSQHGVWENSESQWVMWRTAEQPWAHATQWVYGSLVFLSMALKPVTNPVKVRFEQAFLHLFSYSVH